MVGTAALAEIGALVGDPGRANMLTALLDGRALTASELAALAGVTPQTASGHLSRLLTAGLIAVEQQGRHRYHRLASAEVAAMLEGMMQVAAMRPPPTRAIRIGPRDAALRAARTCYDHLAGRLGVAIAESLTRRDLIEFEHDGGAVTPAGDLFLHEFGVDARRIASRRVFCRPCLDWSERRPHVAGGLGAAILTRSLELGWIRRTPASRAVAVTPAGQLGFRRMFEIQAGS